MPEIFMEFILFTLITLIVIVALMASRLTNNRYPFPFDRKSTVFTAAEKNFQGLLEQAVGAKFRIVNRVKIADLITIRQGVSKKASHSALAHANNKYVDFIICHRDSMQLAGAIDLVDTNGKGYKVKKDWFVSGALEAASIPHLRIKVKGSYTLAEIRACINNRILGGPAPTPKFKGRVLPAPLVKARPKNSGVITSQAARISAQKENPLAAKLQAQQIAALPH
jgi:uncharacterized protein DUF2726